MTYNELNQYILNYIENDKTNSAIMLTGGWGSGKSYYIEHFLMPFLSKKGRECVLVSLYGLKELNEINKSIYFELRLKKLNLSGEKAKAAILAGKTVIRGLAGFFSVDLSQNGNDWQELYESIDLTDKLLIFEDVERTGIDIIELLGFVNNITEHSSAKVLLVTNESEFAKKIKVDEIVNSDEKKEIFDYTKESKMYLSYKEKTVNDTIVFYPKVNETVMSILQDFNNSILDKYKTDSFCDNVSNIFYFHQTTNFRTFIFATQKFVEIIKSIDVSSYPDDFIEDIYYSIISFSILFKSNVNITWKGNGSYSLELGLVSCPLHKAFFEYIMYQKKDFSTVNAFFNDYLELVNHKGIIDTFKKYLYLPEKEIIKKLNELKQKLQRNEISIGIYPELLTYLVEFETYFDYDIHDVIQNMIFNTKGKSEKLGGEDAFNFEVFSKNQVMFQRYYELANMLIDSAEENEKLYSEWFNSPKSIVADCEKIKKLYSGKLQNKPFATKIDIEKLVGLFIKCSAEQMVVIRRLFKYIYEKNNFERGINEEKDMLEQLIIYLQKADISELDKIQLLHFNWFIEQLREYINQFEELLNYGKILS